MYRFVPAMEAALFPADLLYPGSFSYNQRARQVALDDKTS